MARFTGNLWALGRARRAVTSLEYGIIAALVACAIIGQAGSIGTRIARQFTDIAKVLSY